MGELRAVDPTLGTLRNLNTPDDYHAALRDAGLPIPELLPFVTVEFFGVPRLRAGRSRVTIESWATVALCAAGELPRVISAPELATRASSWLTGSWYSCGRV